MAATDTVLAPYVRSFSIEPSFAPHSSVDVFVAALDSPEIDIDFARRVLSPEELQRAAKFVDIKHANRFVAGRFLLRQTLQTYLGAEASAISIQYGANGKPYVLTEANRPSIHFNISHSSDCLVMAFCKDLSLGVDVEQVRDFPDMDAVAEYTFSKLEYATYLNLPQSERAIGFFNCWTRKEAFVKALGFGLGYPLGSFDVTLVPGVPAKVQRMNISGINRHDIELFAFVPIGKYIGCIALQTKMESRTKTKQPQSDHVDAIRFE